MSSFQIGMSRRIIFVCIIVLIALTPTNALLYKALKYITGQHGRDLAATASTYDDHVNDGTSYNDNILGAKNHNSFGFEHPGQTGMSDGSVNGLPFISGPQNIQTSNFVGEYTNTEANHQPIPDSTENDYYGYFENTKIDASSCQDLDRNSGLAGFFTDASNPRTSVVSIRCEARNGDYCANIVNGQELQVDSIDYCHLVDVPDIIDNLLSTASTSQEDLAYTGGVAWKTKAVPTYNYNAMIALSTGGAAADDSGTTITNRIKRTQFQPEDFDILDQQCYSLMTADRKEFDSIHCEAANHERLGGSGQQNLLTEKYVSNPNDLLNWEGDEGETAPAENVDDGDDDCDNDDVSSNGEIKRSGCGYKQLLGSRYQNQEYCLSNKDKTMFKELFGCADDQREVCGPVLIDGTHYYSDDGCTTDKTADQRRNLYKIIDADTPDEACVSVPNDCAGGIDEDVIAQHADYLPDNWASGHKNFKYGTDGDANYICSEVEIVVANELSSYLDRTDHDITKACEHAIDTFDKASEAYVDFIDPLAIKVAKDEDDEATDDDETQSYHNLYSVLREAWRQAEFTLRSIKIQEQVRDRMLKYRDWTLGRFDKVTSAETGETQINNNLEAPGGLTPRTASYVNSRDVYRNFLNEWDGYIKDYEKLSLSEIKALRTDLDDILKEVAEAKEFAQELANTQQAASAAVATVSIHFRKKLNFWVQMESLIEEAFKTSLDNAKALQGQTHRSHLNANYARTDVHEPPEDEGFDYQVTRAEIQAGEDYNGFEGRTYDQDGQIENQGTAQRKAGGEAISSSSSFVSDYDCASLSPDTENSQTWGDICVGQCKVDDEEAPTACVQKDAERKSEFTSSNAAITTSLKCGTDDAICDNAFGYTDANQPTLNRVSSCVGGYCQIAASNVVSDNSAVSKQTIEIEPTDTNYHGIATDKSVADDSAPHGGVAKEDDGSYSNQYVNSEKANIKFTHTVSNSPDPSNAIDEAQINNYNTLENAENAITDVDGQEPTGQLRDSATNKRTNDNSNPPAAADEGAADEGAAGEEGGDAGEGDADEGGAAACDLINDVTTCQGREDCHYNPITGECGALQNIGDLGDVVGNP